MRKTGIWAVSIIMVLLMGNCARNEQREELTAEGNWLKDHIHEMETTNPVPSNLDDLNPLMAMAENARIVGIGEATHGTSQFFKIWHRVFKALVMNHGYRLIIMEMDLIPYYRMNNYIVKDEGIIDIWFYGPRTREINDLIDWMHQYNLGKADNDKIWLLGSDCRSYREHIDYILEVTKDIDAGLSGKLAGLYAELYAFESGFDYRDEAPEAQKSRVRSDLQKARDAIINQQGSIVASIGEWDYSFLQRAATVVIQSEEFYAFPDSPSIRDQHMAGNIRWLTQRFGNARTLITAHNEHVAYRVRDDLYNLEWDSIGYFLREYFGAGYLSIGQTFFQGSFFCYWGTGVVGPALEDSYEYYFEQAKTPLFYLDLRQLDLSATGAWWVDGPRRFRLIDERFTAETTEEETYCVRPIRQDFDIIIYIDQSSPYTWN